MRAKVTRVKDLKAVLRDLERFVRTPDFLRKGRDFKNFPLRPRELLANLLICFVGNFENEDNQLTVCTDPLGGDGLIFNQKNGKYMSTEHVFVPAPRSDNVESVEDKIASAIAHKNKKGRSYAGGKDLVVFSEAIGSWHPNKVARRIVGAHGFNSVWVVHLERADDRGYAYCLSWLDVSHGAAPAWEITINAEFNGLTVERVQ